MRKKLFTGAMTIVMMASSGCATLSFAPPSVTLQSRPAPTFNDAMTDVDSFIVAYRKAARTAANGRTAFQVPAFVATVAAVTATALGAGPDVTIAAGGAAAIFGGGNAYFAPKTKASILHAGLTAMQCIQQVATGVAPFVTAAAATEARIAAEAANGNQEAHYYLIRNAAISVDTIVGDRLSNAGSLTDAQALASDYEKHVTELVKKREAGPASVRKTMVAMSFAGTSNLGDDALPKLNELQPKLQLCILVARS